MTKIIFYSILLIASSCSHIIWKIEPHHLAGQTWKIEQVLNAGGFGGGQTWTFLQDNKFTATKWYYGGTYWTHNFSGMYHYEKKPKQYI